MRQIVFSPDTAGLDTRTILQSPGSDEDNVVLLNTIIIVMTQFHGRYVLILPGGCVLPWARKMLSLFQTTASLAHTATKT